MKAGRFRTAITRSNRAAGVVLSRELVLGLAVFGVYLLVKVFQTDGREAAAVRHSLDIHELQRDLNIDFELDMNHWLADHDVLQTLANYEYAWTYILSAFILLFWVFAKRPELYRWCRNSFVALNLLAIAIFAAYPVSPPRHLPQLGFTDTVVNGSTFGSWGGPLVDSANQLAAMPSLHVGWCLWVSAVLARISGHWLVQVISGVHVIVTVLVIMATANHYLLDAVAVVPLVWLSLFLAGRPDGQRVPPSDVFFLRVEKPDAPQQVGGLLMLDGHRAGPVPTRDDIEALVRARVGDLPRFRQRLSSTSRWRRPVWEDHPEVVWDEHIRECDVTRPDGTPGGMEAVHRVVGELIERPIPLDRPPWRMLLITGVDDGQVALVVVMHHMVADGPGTVLQVQRLFDMPLSPPPVPDLPGTLLRAAGTAKGMAQLATDGSLKDVPSYPASGERRFTTLGIPLAQLRGIATAHGVRVTDVLLCAVAGGLRAALPVPVPPRLRVSIPLTVRAPDSPAEGNFTSAVMVDVPLEPGPEAERLARIAHEAARLRSGTRMLAARFVMSRVGGLMPPPVHAWFARSVYRGRYFQAVVSNMPGSPVECRVAGAVLATALPILPTAPGAPLSVGALGWGPELGLGITTDAAVLPDPERFLAGLQLALADLQAAAPVPMPGQASAATG